MNRRSRKNFLTDPISCDFGGGTENNLSSTETSFEKKRGISKIEVRGNLSKVIMGPVREPIVESRLRLLQAIADSGLSIQFSKLTPVGLTFLVANQDTTLLPDICRAEQCPLEIIDGQSMVLVHAVNMRDEEGLIAKLISVAIGSGAPVHHVGDMHDRLMIATTVEGTRQIQEALIREFPGGES